MATRKSMSLEDAVERLVPKKRGQGRLTPAPNREGIGVSISIGYPSASATGGIASPLTEQPYTGSSYLDFPSSDGLFLFEYPAETVYIDGNGDSVTVIHLAQ